MPHAITRREFIDGAAVTVAGSLLPHAAAHAQAGAFLGQTDASFATLHRWRRAGGRSEIPPHAAGDEVFDLVVVGGGISGLAEAILWRQQRPGASVLLVDPQADIGGHALRNEFVSASGRRAADHRPRRLGSARLAELLVTDLVRLIDAPRDWLAGPLPIHTARPWPIRMPVSLPMCKVPSIRPHARSASCCRGRGCRRGRRSLGRR